MSMEIPMEIPQVDEVSLSVEVYGAQQRKKVQVSAPERRKCIYKKDVICQAPDCKMEICEKCPYGTQATFSSAVKDVFNNIVSIAIFLAKSDDVLRDVMVLVGKRDSAEGQVLSDNGQGARSPILLGVKGQEITDTPRPEIKKIAPKIEEGPEEGPIEIKPVISKKLLPAIGDIRREMSNEIAQKIADIDEALANPEGEGEAPLI